MENFPKVLKEIDIQAQIEQKVPNKINSKSPTGRHIIIKMTKAKKTKRDSWGSKS